jgi:hypothetical protein
MTLTFISELWVICPVHIDAATCLGALYAPRAIVERSKEALARAPARDSDPCERDSSLHGHVAGACECECWLTMHMLLLQHGKSPSSALIFSFTNTVGDRMPGVTSKGGCNENAREKNLTGGEREGGGGGGGAV